MKGIWLPRFVLQIGCTNSNCETTTSETDISLLFHHLDMTLVVAEALSPKKLVKSNLDMTLAVVEVLGPNKPNQTLICPWLLVSVKP